MKQAVKDLKRIGRIFFDFNTGYFLKSVTYYYNGEYHVGYILCRGWKIFGIHGYDRIKVFIDRIQAKDELNKLQ